MNVSEALADIRFKIHDTDVIEMTNEELLICLNEAIQYVASYLIGANSPAIVANMIVSEEETTLPVNFVKTAGVFPIVVTGNTMRWLDYEEGQTMKLRYFASCEPVLETDEMPFKHDALNQITIKLAAIYAGNQLEAEVSQDKALLDEINAAIAQAAFGVAGGGAT